MRVRPGSAASPRVAPRTAGAKDEIAIRFGTTDPPSGVP
jgi:hypothetical protein